MSPNLTKIKKDLPKPNQLNLSLLSIVNGCLSHCIWANCCILSDQFSPTVYIIVKASFEKETHTASWFVDLGMTEGT